DEKRCQPRRQRVADRGAPRQKPKRKEQKKRRSEINAGKAAQTRQDAERQRALHGAAEIAVIERACDGGGEQREGQRRLQAISECTENKEAEAGDGDAEAQRHSLRSSVGHKLRRREAAKKREGQPDDDIELQHRARESAFVASKHLRGFGQSSI